MIILAIVHGPFGSESERRIRDLSATGACIEQSGNLIVGDEVALEVGALSGVPAKVVWVSESLAGIRFDDPIDLAAASRPRMRAVTAASGWVTL